MCCYMVVDYIVSFFFNDTAPTEIYPDGHTLSLHDALPILALADYEDRFVIPTGHREDAEDMFEERGSCGFSFGNGCSGGSNSHCRRDRKSTRLNSSH